MFQSSLEYPGNVPIVISSTCILYQTKAGGFQEELPLQLGLIVNGIFKNHNWIYVTTAHAEEGYVFHKFCMPLCVLPTKRKQSSKGYASSLQPSIGGTPTYTKIYDGLLDDVNNLGKSSAFSRNSATSGSASIGEVTCDGSLGNDEIDAIFDANNDMDVLGKDRANKLRLTYNNILENMEEMRYVRSGHLSNVLVDWDNRGNGEDVCDSGYVGDTGSYERNSVEATTETWVRNKLNKARRDNGISLENGPHTNFLHDNVHEDNIQTRDSSFTDCGYFIDDAFEEKERTITETNEELNELGNYCPINGNFDDGYVVDVRCGCEYFNCALRVENVHNGGLIEKESKWSDYFQHNDICEPHNPYNGHIDSNRKCKDPFQKIDLNNKLNDQFSNSDYFHNSVDQYDHQKESYTAIGKLNEQRPRLVASKDKDRDREHCSPNSNFSVAKELSGVCHHSTPIRQAQPSANNPNEGRKVKKHCSSHFAHEVQDVGSTEQVQSQYKQVFLDQMYWNPNLHDPNLGNVPYSCETNTNVDFSSQNSWETLQNSPFNDNHNRELQKVNNLIEDIGEERFKTIEKIQNPEPILGCRNGTRVKKPCFRVHKKLEENGKGTLENIVENEEEEEQTPKESNKSISQTSQKFQTIINPVTNRERQQQIFRNNENGLMFDKVNDNNAIGRPTALNTELHWKENNVSLQPRTQMKLFNSNTIDRTPVNQSNHFSRSTTHQMDLFDRKTVSTKPITNSNLHWEPNPFFFTPKSPQLNWLDVKVMDTLSTASYPLRGTSSKANRSPSVDNVSICSEKTIDELYIKQVRAKNRRKYSSDKENSYFKSNREDFKSNIFNKKLTGKDEIRESHLKSITNNDKMTMNTNLFNRKPGKDGFRVNKDLKSTKDVQNGIKVNNSKSTKDVPNGLKHTNNLILITEDYYNEDDKFHVAKNEIVVLLNVYKNWLYVQTDKHQNGFVPSYIGAYAIV